MNERIKELALRAEDYAFDESKKLESSVELVFKNRVFFKSFKEKFAELILKETISVLQKRFMGDLNREDMEVRRCIADIQKHFGVEE
jgi:hypothetical protein